MLNLSIISACNNNCSYCFQKDSYHKSGKILYLDEIAQILKWTGHVERIAVLGGEPTLHPQCVEICELISQNYNSVIFTNLLCDDNKIEGLARINRMRWLVNTTTNPDLQYIFDKNIKYVNNHVQNASFSLGVTLTGNFEEDVRYIENLVRQGKNNQNIVRTYRIAFASPCHDKVFKLKNFDKSINYFYNYSYKHTPFILINFDCSINSCFMSDKVYLRVLQDRRTLQARPVCTPTCFDIMADRSVKYCSSCPDEFFDIRDYRYFPNYTACYNYIANVMQEFLNEYGFFYCKTAKFCTSKTCQGACFAALANLVKQDKMKPEFIQKIKKLQLKYINKR